MFGIGETELVLILLFSFLVFGPDKLPGMGRTLGRALRQFRSAQEGFNKVVQSDLLDPAADVLNEKPKRSEKLRSAASDDSDIDGEAPKQETFAERRARLKAEREAAQKKEAAHESAEGDTDNSAQADTEAPADAAPASNKDVDGGDTESKTDSAHEEVGAAPKASASDTNEKKKTNSARDLRSSRAQKEAAKEDAKEAEGATPAFSEKTLPNESVTSELGEEGEGTE